MRVVNVSTPDGAPLEPAMWDTLRELFARVGVSLTADTPQRDPAAIDVRLAARDRGMDVIVTSAAHEPVHRRVAQSESDELFRETVGHVVLSVVEPLLDSERSPLPPAPPPVVHAPIRVRADIAAGAVMLARGMFAPRVGIAAGAVFPHKRAPTILLEVALAPDASRTQRDVTGRLTLWSLRARPSLEAFRTARVALDVALPIGADLAWFHVTESPRGTASTARTLRADPIVGAMVGLHVAVRRGLSIVTALGVDVGFTPHRFVVRDAQQTVVLAALDAARPYATLALSWSSARGQAP